MQSLWRLSLILFITFLVSIPVLSKNIILNQNGNSLLPSDKRLHETDYVHAYCNGTEEYILLDKTRIDCLTDTHLANLTGLKSGMKVLGKLYDMHIIQVKNLV